MQRSSSVTNARPPDITTDRGAYRINGSAGGLNAYVAGQINNKCVRMLVDTGAFCNCVSSKFFKKWLHRTTSLSPRNDSESFSTANNSNRDVLGSIRIAVKLGGCVIPAKFFVVNVRV